MLAGGAGSRFGPRPKGLATVAGLRVIDRVVAVLRAATDDLLLVANDDGAGEWLPGVPQITDVRRGVGPLGGIHAALTATGNTILVVAWDMPFVAPGLLSELRRLGRHGYAAVVPQSSDGRLEPTCALYAPECLTPLEAWLDAGRSGASEFLEHCANVLRVPLDEVARFGDPARLFFSVNTPQALARAETLAALA